MEPTDDSSILESFQALRDAMTIFGCIPVVVVEPLKGNLGVCDINIVFSDLGISPTRTNLLGKVIFNEERQVWVSSLENDFCFCDILFVHGFSV